MELTGERVVLVDETGVAVGSADKYDVHHTATPLHLAFSCYVFDESGALLVTRRAESKKTWPGVWTNSFCGHPAPGEDFRAAVHRRAEAELGLRVTSLRLVLPAFRYRAVMDDGVVENEVCPVVIGRVAGAVAGTVAGASSGTASGMPAGTAADAVRANPAEVAEARWIAWPEFRDAVVHGHHRVSPWCDDQVRLLADRPDDPGAWTGESWALLPPAARVGE